MAERKQRSTSGSLSKEQYDTVATLLPLLQGAENVQVVIRREGREQQFDASWLRVLLTLYETAIMTEQT